MDWFLSLEDAPERTESRGETTAGWWLHSSLDNLGPRQYLDGKGNSSPDSLPIAGPVLG